ncbi:MAG: DUF2612 domain-containing protein [Azoarcus sp.]|jgi:hypothetical protein|nr:DUF2612 domain-containing protein [Azoarcus sp.]
MKVYDLDTSLDLLRALLWQYNDAAHLQALVRAKQAWIDANHDAFWRGWLRDVFDLRTANDFGLRVWSAILGVKAVTEIPATDKANFGFGAANRNFGNGNFGQIGTRSHTLDTEQKRLLLRLRYFQMVARCTVPETNRFMAAVFSQYGRVFVLDGNDMSQVVFVFSFVPSADIRFIIDNFALLPRPAGVGARYTVVTRPVFGFGDVNKNFNHATFKGDI